jgi:hypothetical protein
MKSLSNQRCKENPRLLYCHCKHQKEAATKLYIRTRHQSSLDLFQRLSICTCRALLNEYGGQTRICSHRSFWYQAGFVSPI